MRPSASQTCVELASEGEKCFLPKFSQVPHAVSPCETGPCNGIGGLSVTALMLCLSFRLEASRMFISVFIGSHLVAICPFCPRLTFGVRAWSVVTLIDDISGLPQEWLLPVYTTEDFIP